MSFYRLLQKKHVFKKPNEKHEEKNENSLRLRSNRLTRLIEILLMDYYS